MRRLVIFLRSGEDDVERVIIEHRGTRRRVAWGDHAEEFDAARLPDGRFSLLFEDGRQFCGRIRERGPDGVEVVRGGGAVRVPIARTRRARAGRPDADAGGIEEVRALMHGRIVEVRLEAGDRVEEGGLLLVLEAMKMQNEIRASRAGVIERLSVSSGQTVEGGEFLLSIQSDKN
jgi:biotin carboxyl carrier protein